MLFFVHVETANLLFPMFIVNADKAVRWNYDNPVKCFIAPALTKQDLIERWEKEKNSTMNYLHTYMD